MCASLWMDIIISTVFFEEADVLLLFLATLYKLFLFSEQRRRIRLCRLSIWQCRSSLAALALFHLGFLLGLTSHNLLDAFIGEQSLQFLKVLEMFLVGEG